MNRTPGSRGSNPKATHGEERERKPAYWIVTYLLVAVPYAVLVRYFWFVTDDAFILFRYARNFAAGLGLRFNLGEGPPVEGQSNFLWTSLLAGVDLLGLDMVGLAPWISFALGLVLLGLVYRFLIADLRASPGTAVLALLFPALSPVFATWSSGGLGTMLFALLFFLAFRFLFPGATGPRPFRAGLSAGLLALTRPEGFPWALTLAALFLLQVVRKKGTRPVKTLSIYMAVLLSFFLPFLAARYAYYGYLLPNTVAAKSELSSLTLQRGLYYTLTYLLYFITPLVFLLASFLCLKRKTPSAVYQACLVFLGFLCFSILCGGDFMAMGRLMAPATPFMAVMAAHLLGRYVMGRKYAVFGHVFCAALILSQLLPAFDLSLVPGSIRKSLHFRWNTRLARTEFEQWRMMKDNVRVWTRLGKTLKEHAQPGDTFVYDSIGAVGYYSELTIYDRCGIVDLEVSRRKIKKIIPYSAGHDKYVDAEFFLKRNPTILHAAVVPEEDYKLVQNNYSKHLPSGYRVECLPLPQRNGDAEGPLYLIWQKRME